MSLTTDCIVRALQGLAVAFIVAAPAARSAEVTETPAVAAQQPADALPPQEARRLRIGLVLSGGGARGIAHLGVLKVLEQHRVPIDAIAGTSMGAVVGGLYASGLSADQIENVVMSIDWQEAFRDRTQRARLSFRRKQDDQNFLVRLPLGLKGGHFLLPRGLIQGQKLNQILRSLTLPTGAVDDFDQLPVPFRAVATDLETGQPVVMRFGDLASTMRASMSVPGVFTPVVIEDRVLVDGGLAENLPIDVARNMGVDILIVSDVSFPLQPRSRLNSALEVSNQMFAILVRRDAERQRATLTDQDIVIDAPLENMSSLDFTRVRATVAAGMSAAQEAVPRLDALALSPADYATYVARRERQREQPRRVDFVRADPDSKQYEKPIDAVFGSFVGKPLDVDKVEDKVEELYGLDLFETVDYRLLREDDAQGLEISARRKSWGPNYVRFGLALQDDFEGNNFFNAAARVIVTEINPLGAEWLSDVQVGENPLFFTEFYQPLTYGSRYFIAPHLRYEVRNLHILADQQAVADYRVRAGEAGLDFGREFSSWGELRAGIRRGQGRTRLRLGEPVLADDRFNTGAYFMRLSYDKLDNANFPRNGALFTLQWQAGRTGLGDDNTSDLLALDYLVARTRGRHTLLSWTSLGSTIDNDDDAIQDFFTLGGFFQLSGLKPNSLSGAHFGISRLIYYRQIGRQGPGFLNVASYVGMSLEAGNVWNDRSEASFGSAFKDASIFLGLDTLLGPLYLATGYDDQGQTAFYLFLGRPF